MRMLLEDFPEERFAVAGVVDSAGVADYLRLPNVLCVHMPWLVSDSLLRGGRWSEIETLARSALAQVQRAGGGS